MIEIKNLTKVYNQREKEVTALQEVNLLISRGEFVCVIGPSGSGKSTFLLALGGLIRPTTGKIYIEGNSIYDLTVSERAKIRQSTLGFIFQTFNLIPYLTALENVQVPLCIAKNSHKEQIKIATELLEKFGLGDRFNHKPAELSVGEQQRVALARALANKPSILLADEPTGNLDPICTGEVFDYFRRLHQEGMTVVVVTHDYDAAKCANRQLEIIEGRLSEKKSVSGR